MTPSLVQRDVNADLQIQKTIARLCLRAGRVREALDIYTRLLAHFPQEADVYFVLANLYLASGYSLTAAVMYAQVLRAMPEHLPAARQLGIAKEAAAGGQVEPEVEAFPLHPRAIAQLAERLEAIGGQPGVGECIRQAADGGDNEPERQTGPGADQLLPALIDLNLKHARAAGQAELVEVLVSLQVLLRQTTEIQQPETGL